MLGNQFHIKLFLKFVAKKLDTGIASAISGKSASVFPKRAQILLHILITGFGITHPYIIEPATFGLLQKSTSYIIHTLSWGPFLILLLIHIYLTLPDRKRNREE